MPTPTKRIKQPVGAMDEATEYLRYLAILVGVYLIQTAIRRQIGVWREKRRRRREKMREEGYAREAETDETGVMFPREDD